jgi:hypothetical protein
MKLYMLKQLLKAFHFRHADKLVELLEEQKRKALRPEGFVIGNNNPLLIMALLTEILQNLKTQFRSLSLRIDFVHDGIFDDLVEVFENMYRPREIELMLKHEDIHGKSVLLYIAELKLYRFLQINHVNRIVNQMWESKTCVSGSIYDLSTSYYLTFKNKIRY